MEEANQVAAFTTALVAQHTGHKCKLRPDRKGCANARAWHRWGRSASKGNFDLFPSLVMSWEGPKGVSLGPGGSLKLRPLTPIESSKGLLWKRIVDSSMSGMPRPTRTHTHASLGVGGAWARGLWVVMVESSLVMTR